MLVAGPTGSGKTVKIMQLIDNAETISNPSPVEIIYCYGAWQKTFDAYVGRVRFHEGVIDVETLPDDGRLRWLVLDDLMETVMKRDGSSDLFTKHSHHKNLSVIFVVQNLFHKNIRTVSINSQYILLAKSPRDASSITNLAKQAFPGRIKYVMDAYADATRRPHSFLMMDLRQETNDDRRLLGNFPPLKHQRTVVYVPKGV